MIITQSNIQAYFRAEKTKGLFFMVFGIAGAIAALLFFMSKSWLFQGMAVPMTLIGISQLIMGYAIYSGNDKLAKELDGEEMNIAVMKEKELPRLEREIRTVGVYQKVELAFIAVGLIMAVAFRSDENREFLYGFGLALAVYVFAMFIGDYMTERRGRAYLSNLKKHLHTNGFFFTEPIG